MSRVVHGVDDVVHCRERALRPGGGIAETAEVQPDHVSLSGQCLPLRLPHPAVGDAGVEQHDG